MKKLSVALIATAMALALSPAVIAQEATFNFSFAYAPAAGQPYDTGIYANGWVTGTLITAGSVPGVYPGLSGVYNLTGGEITIWGAESGTDSLVANPAGAANPGIFYDAANGSNWVDLFYSLGNASNSQYSNGYVDFANYKGGLDFGNYAIWFGDNNGNGDGYSVMYDPRGYIADTIYSPNPAASGTTFGVPDGGTTLALLGLAIAGLAGLRRKLSK